MRKLSLIFAFILVIAFGASAFSQCPVTITNVDGAWDDGGTLKLNPGAVVTVGIEMVNDCGVAGEGYNPVNCFTLSSPDGAGWTYFKGVREYGSSPWLTEVPTPGWSQSFVNHFEWDGAAWNKTADSLGYPNYVTIAAGANGGGKVGIQFAGAAFFPGGGIATGLSLTLGLEFQTLPSDEGKTLCINSDPAMVAGGWMWANVGGNITPGWGGEACYVIEEMPNEPPHAVAGSITNYSFNHCVTGQFTIDFEEAEDEFPYTFELVSGPGAIVAVDDNTVEWSWNGAPQTGFETVEIKAKDTFGTDHFGAAWSVNIEITNDGPVITDCPEVVGGLTIQTGDTKTQTVVATDDCDVLVWTVLPGDFDPLNVTVVDGVVSFTPDAPARLVEITVEATDGLETVECTTLWNVIEGAPYGVQIEKEHDELQNHFSDVDITLLGVDPLEGIGGFDLLIAYDQTALAFQVAFEGQIYADCGWEYFTFRQGPFGNCGNGCPSGMVRIIGVAEQNDGPHHPTCDVNTLPVTLATMRFLVSDDRNLECQYVPVRFYWIDCGDNTISNIAGTQLYISAKVFDFDLAFNPDPIDNGTVGFPTFQGAQNFCLENPMEGKPLAIRNIDFINGGVDIICAEDIDARGDLNLNNLAYEIADAVMFTNYFIEGLSAFEYVEGAIAASDVNADGIPLTVSDLVYLLRVVVGDAIAYPKLNPMVSSYSHEGGVVSVDADMFAAHIVLSGNADVSLMADGMEMKTGMVDGNLNVIVYSMNANQTFVGNFLQTNAEIVSVDFATYDGQPVVAKNVPKTFAVMQNYPNPFNPTTDIQFALPLASDYSISIYNVAGQLVETISGQSDAGVVTATWDASDLASGVYFYKVAAGEFSKTMKAVLLK